MSSDESDDDSSESSEDIEPTVENQTMRATNIITNSDEVEEVKQPFAQMNMNVKKPSTMASRVKEKKLQKAAYSPFMVNNGINTMKENFVSERLFYDDGTEAE